MTVAVETTFAKYAGKRAGNYSTLPTKDVEILPKVHHCEGCGAEGEYVQVEGQYIARFTHPEPCDSYMRPRAMCVYCHCDEPGAVKFMLMSWSDETHCERCGGVDGRAIGD